MTGKNLIDLVVNEFNSVLFVGLDVKFLNVELI